MSESDQTSSTEIDTAPQTFPQVNSYVVFSIDPWASLAFGHEIKNITEELVAITNRKYVALVSEVVEIFYVDEKPYHLWQFEFLRKGPCPQRSTESRILEPSASIPVEPITHNPTPWKPITLSQPLPWNHCFHYSFYGWTEVRCRSRSISATPKYHMSADEKSRLTHMRTSSIRREEAARKNPHPKNLQNPEQPKIPAESINQYLEGSFRVVVDCSYELDSIEEFDDPFLFFDDANYLAKLKVDMKRAKGPLSPGSSNKTVVGEIEPRKVPHPLIDRLHATLSRARSATRRMLTAVLR